MSDLSRSVSRIVAEIAMIEDEYLELKKTAGKEVALEALDNTISDIYECYNKLDRLFSEENEKNYFFSSIPIENFKLVSIRGKNVIND